MLNYFLKHCFILVFYNNRLYLRVKRYTKMWFKKYLWYRMSKDSPGKYHKGYSQSDIARKIGVSPQTIQKVLNQKNKTTMKEENKRKTVLIFNDTYEHAYKIGTALLNGEPPDNKVNLPTIEQHKDTVTKFQNPLLALEINQKLLELEKINPSALRDILKHIKWKIYEEKGNPDVELVSSTPEQKNQSA